MERRKEPGTDRCYCYKDYIHPSVLYIHLFCSMSRRLEPIPACVWRQAGCNLDKFSGFHKANTLRQTQYIEFPVHLPFRYCMFVEPTFCSFFVCKPLKQAIDSFPTARGCLFFFLFFVRHVCHHRAKQGHSKQHVTRRQLEDVKVVLKSLSNIRVGHVFFC